MLRDFRASFGGFRGASYILYGVAFSTARVVHMGKIKMVVAYECCVWIYPKSFEDSIYTHCCYTLLYISREG